MLTDESAIGPKRPRYASYAHLRQAARWILLNQLHDLSRYEIVTPAILHRIELCRVGMVSSEPFGILLGVASIRSVDDDLAIPSSRETTVIVRKSRRGQRQTDDSQKENTNDVSHIDCKKRKDGSSEGPRQVSNDRSQHDEFLARRRFFVRQDLSFVSIHFLVMRLRAIRRQPKVHRSRRRSLS
jgi:hypothetical protein